MRRISLSSALALLVLGIGRAAASTPKDREYMVREIIRQADAKIRQADFTGAIEDADRAIAEYPGADLQALNVKAKAYNIKANAHNQLKQYAAADEAARQSLAQEGANPVAFENLAWAQLHQGRFELYLQALENADKAIALNARISRESAMAYYLKACAEEQLGKTSEELKDIWQAAQLNPRYLKYDQAAREGRKIFQAREEDEAGAPSMSAMAKESLARYAWPGAGVLALILGVLGFQLFQRQSGGAAAIKSAGIRERLEEAPDEFRSGGLLAGKYELTRVIGKGGMGEVWEARDRSLDRLVAVKRMSLALGSLGAQAKALYLKEARTLASVHHPNIMDIFEILDLPSGMYLIFEWMAGKTVAQILAEKKRLGLAASRDILRPVCQALDWAHSQGIIHRDLKPSNIMVMTEGFIKVMDFGLARQAQTQAPALEAGITPFPQMTKTPALGILHTQTVGGTPAYMAPETEQGIISAGSDIYSLGITFYEMLTGELPFGLRGLGKLDLKYAKAGARVPGLSPEIDALIAAALAPRPESRIPSARQFLQRLESLKG